MPLRHRKTPEPCSEGLQWPFRGQECPPPFPQEECPSKTYANMPIQNRILFGTINSRSSSVMRYALYYFIAENTRPQNGKFTTAVDFPTLPWSTIISAFLLRYVTTPEELRYDMLSVHHANLPADHARVRAIQYICRYCRSVDWPDVFV